MSLWEMLTLFAGATTFGSALAAASALGGGALRLSVGGVLGLCLGALSFYAARVAGERVFRQVRAEGWPSSSARRLRFLNWAAVAWCAVASGLCFQLTHTVIRMAIGS